MLFFFDFVDSSSKMLAVRTTLFPGLIVPPNLKPVAWVLDLRISETPNAYAFPGSLRLPRNTPHAFLSDDVLVFRHNLSSDRRRQKYDSGRSAPMRLVPRFSHQWRHMIFRSNGSQLQHP